MERPNMDTSFSVSVSTQPLQPSTANVIHADGIAELLTSYPNQRFVDTLISIATYGARVGFESISSGCAHHPNHSSALTHPDIVTQAIQAEIETGRVKQITDLPTSYFCSPIGLVPKTADGIPKE